MPDLPPTASGPVHPAVHREKTDADPWGILLFGATLVLLAIIAHVIVFGMFRSIEKKEKAGQPEQPPVARELPGFPQDLHREPSRVPEPHLQVRDDEDMRKLRAREEAMLHGQPGWVDQHKGIAHFPIEAVLDLLADPQTAAALGVRTRAEKGKKK